MTPARHLFAALVALSLTGTGCGTTGPFSPPPNGPDQRWSQDESVQSGSPAVENASSDGGGRHRASVTAAPTTPQGAYGEHAPSAADPVAPPPGYGYHIAQPEPKPVIEEERHERPGLATVFGETRTSRVHDVEFVRAEGAPLAVASFYYNDRAGAEAMAAPDARRAGHLDDGVPMRGGVTVTLVDENGAPFDSFALGGRVYVVGEVGRRYSVLVHNQTGRRYEIVGSVDGLDVIDGRPAATGKRGYLIEPWGSLTIDGFRRNQDEVAAFRFGPVASSYAARTVGDRNVGVIGLALFDERGATPWNDDEIQRRRTAEPFADGRFSQPPLE